MNNLRKLSPKIVLIAALIGASTLHIVTKAGDIKTISIKKVKPSLQAAMRVSQLLCTLAKSDYTKSTTTLPQDTFSKENILIATSDRKEEIIPPTPRLTPPPTPPPTPTPTGLPLTAIRDYSNTLEKLREADPVVHDIRQATLISGASASAASYSWAPFIRQLPSEDWVKSIKKKEELIARFKEEERQREYEKKAQLERERRERLEEEEQAFLQRERLAQFKKKKLEKQKATYNNNITQPYTALLKAPNTALLTVDDILRLRRKIKSIRTRLQESLNEIESAEDHYINQIRSDVQNITNFYLPHLINNPIEELLIVVVKAINILYEELPESGDPEPITDQEMRDTIAPNLEILVNNFHTMFKSTPAPQSVSAFLLPPSARDVASSLQQQLQEQLKAVRTELLRALDQIDPKKYHSLNILRPDIQKIANHYLPHFIDNPTIEIPATVINAIKKLHAALPEACDTYPLTEDEVINHIVPEIATLMDNFNYRFKTAPQPVTSLSSAYSSKTCGNIATPVMDLNSLEPERRMRPSMLMTAAPVKVAAPIIPPTKPIKRPQLHYTYPLARLALNFLRGLRHSP